MKKPEEVMEILEAYDLTGSFRQAAALVGCEGSYVKPSLCDGGARPLIAVKGCRCAARCARPCRAILDRAASARG